MTYHEFYRAHWHFFSRCKPCQKDKYGARREMTMTRNDVLDVLRQLCQEAQDDFGIIRIGVFGSAARDELSDGSDVDVVVEIVHPDLFTLIGIKQELETMLARPVDIVRYRQTMNRVLRERIDREAVYV